MNDNKELRLKLLQKGTTIPEYKSEKAAGFDIAAPYHVCLMPGEKAVIKLGWACAIPADCEMQIRPRSGTAFKTNIGIANSPGTIDEDYRGEVGVIVENKSDRNVVNINAGDRIAQAVICPVYRVNMVICEELDETDRGEGGFGSTGGN
jgi:dUTP pyrophosphatase